MGFGKILSAGARAGISAEALRRRLKAAIVGGACAALLAAALSLSPDGRRFGTAKQLGLPGCSFLANTGWPCPTCGMTTSVAASVRGEILTALRAHPLGVVLALAAVLLGAASAAQLVSGRDVLGAFKLNRWWFLAGLGGLFLGWGIKVVIGLSDGTLPLK